MRTVSFDIEQHILLAALESSSRKVRHYLLAETRAIDFGTAEGKLIRKRMALLHRGSKSKGAQDSLGDASVFREDVALSKPAKEMLSPTDKGVMRKARLCSFRRAKALIHRFQQYRQARILMEGAKELYNVCTGKQHDDTIAQAQDVMLATIKALREKRGKNIKHYGSGRSKQDIKADIKKLFRVDKRMFVTTGLDMLDAEIGGYGRGDLVVMTAPRGSGKSALAVQIAINQFRAGLNVGIVSLEMSEDQLYQRLVTNVAELSGFKIRTRTLTKAEKNKAFREWASFELATAAQHNNKFSIWDIKDPTYRVENMELDLGPFGYDVIILDYITLLSTGKADLWLGQKDTSRYLKALAGRLNCCMIVLTQMNKDEGVKYGTGPEEDADWWLKWRYGEEEKATGKVSVELAKARHARSCTINTLFDLDRMKVQCIGVTDTYGRTTNSSAVTRAYPGEAAPVYAIDSPLDDPTAALNEDAPTKKRKKRKQPNKKRRKRRPPEKAAAKPRRRRRKKPRGEEQSARAPKPPRKKKRSKRRRSALSTQYSGPARYAKDVANEFLD